jgi:FkbM family methyltransferase
MRNGAMSTLRQLIEKIAHRITFTRSYGADFGNAKLCVSPAASLKYLIQPLNLIDPMLLKVVDHFVAKGDTVWDLGANVGLFSFASAFKVGSKGMVLAVEPDSFLVELLYRSKRINHDLIGSVEILNTCVADKLFLSDFCISKRGRASNAISGFGSSQMGGVSEIRKMVTVNLDWLLEYFSPPQLVKIDVEGAEKLVLNGGAKLIEKHQPVILCEVSSNTAGEISDLLHACNYQLYDLESYFVNPVPTAAFNTIAIPTP